MWAPACAQTYEISNNKTGCFPSSPAAQKAAASRKVAPVKAKAAAPAAAPGAAAGVRATGAELVSAMALS